MPAPSDTASARVPPAGSAEGSAALVCYCRRVPPGAIDQAIDAGAASIADLQRETTACTRCFGCRFDLERMLRERLGDEFQRTAFVTRPPAQPARRRLGRILRRNGARSKTRLAQALGGAVLPRRMYMPVLAGFRGYEVMTRVVMFNWHGDDDHKARPVKLRADLLGLDGQRHEAREAVVGRGCSAILDVGEMAGADELADGVGVLKLVVEAESLGSLRPYFQLVSRNGISTTHEKAGHTDLSRFPTRSSHTVFPVGPPSGDEEAYFFFTNSQERPMTDHELIWESEDGGSASARIPDLELDQSTCFPLHEHFPQLMSGARAGSVRLRPSAHKIVGWMIRHDPKAELWRVQHL